MRRLGRDVRYAGRRLLARAFTLIAVGSLALGIGANAAMFTVVNEVIFRRPPVTEPERLINIYRTAEAFGAFEPLSYPDYRDVVAVPDVFAGVAAARMGLSSWVDGDRVERVTVQFVTGNYFPTLGIRPGRGQLIGPDDAPIPGRGGNPVVVLSDRFWNRVFGRDPGVVGRTLRLGGGQFTVVGIAPSDFSGAFPAVGIDLFAPMTSVSVIMPSLVDELEARGNYSNFIQARLAPGVSIPQARAALGALAASLHEQRIDGWEGIESFTVLPSREVLLYPPIDRVLRPVAVVMMLVVGMVLAIACANLAGFLLARAVDRRKEVAVRLAIGATRSQLIAQLLVETVLLAAVGGVAGVLLGRLALRALLSADLPIPLPIDLTQSIDGRMLVFMIGITLVAGVAFGLAPALQATRLDLAGVIRDESTGGGRTRGRLRQLLVTGQVAVSVVLLLAAVLFARSVGSMRDIDPGFGRQPTALLWLAASGNRPGEAIAAESDAVVRAIAALPGSDAVGRVDNLHLNLLGNSTTEVNVDGATPPEGQPAFSIDRVAIDTGFISAAGLRLVEGRNFLAEEADTSRRVAIVNEAFVAKFWPGQSGLGKRFRRRGGLETEIVGVVATAKIRSLAEAPRPALYEPLRDQSTVWYLVRGPSPDTRLASLVAAARTAAPDAMVIETRSMARHFQVMTLPLELGANALAAFALLALVMASVGLYGTVSYAVAQRSREVGIRLSLGASASAVIRLLLFDGLKLVVAGAAAGLVLGFLFGQALERLLYGVRALDPAALASVPLVLVLVAFVAAYLPARRAGRIAPVSALKAAD
ncbi:MAG: ADOP family duplicated permease [Gemmatimonadales bacterium]